MNIKKLVDKILPSRKRKIAAIVLAGIVGGTAIFTMYTARVHSYLSDDPATCVNCHIMGSYYATWSHSSHSRNATCNDCHVPHTGFARKWFFKGKDGLRHAAIFTMRGEPQVIRAIDESAAVIMENCIRCHNQLNTEFVSTGKITHEMVKQGQGKACWDCHRDIPHGGTNSLSSAPDALVPYPKTTTPQWLKELIE